MHKNILQDTLKYFSNPILPSPFPFLFLCLSSPHSLSKPPSSAWPAPFSPSSSHFLLLLQSVDLYPVLAWG